MPYSVDNPVVGYLAFPFVFFLLLLIQKEELIHQYRKTLQIFLLNVNMLFSNGDANLYRKCM